MQIISKETFEDFSRLHSSFLGVDNVGCFWCRKTNRRFTVLFNSGVKWTIMHEFDIGLCENIHVRYIEPHGIEMFLCRRGHGYNLILPYQISFFDKNGGLQKIDLENKYFLSILNDKYLYVEPNSGHIFCSTFDGCIMWKTEETYSVGDNIDVVLNRGREGVEICIFDWKKYLLNIYLLDGVKKVCLDLPRNVVHEGQYKPTIFETSGHYSLEGFFNDINCYGKYELGYNVQNNMQNIGWQTYFDLKMADHIICCEQYDKNFLAAQISVQENRPGDLIWHIAKGKRRYVTTKVLFMPQSDTRVGGANVKWVDSEHFIYWNHGRKTTFYFVDIWGNIKGKLAGFSNVEDVAICNRTMFILSRQWMGEKNKVEIYSVRL